MKSRSAVIAIVVTSLIVRPTPVWAETPCEDCWNDKCPELKGIAPKCAAPKKDTTPRTDKTKEKKTDDACPAGQERNADTAGKCCWPGQAWNGQRCVGTPTSCPFSFAPDAKSESCLQTPCPEGMARAFDNMHCCWPGQAWSSQSQQCIGAPICPSTWIVEGTSCISPAQRDARNAAKQLADEQARARAATDAAEAERRRVAEQERVMQERVREAEARAAEAERAAQAAREQRAAEERAAAEAQAQQQAQAQQEQAQQEQAAPAESSGDDDFFAIMMGLLLAGAVVLGTVLIIAAAEGEL